MDEDWEELQRQVENESVSESVSESESFLKNRLIHRFIYQRSTEDLHPNPDLSKLSREVYRKFDVKDKKDRMNIYDLIYGQIDLSKRVNLFIEVTTGKITYRKYCDINLQNLWEFLQLFDEEEFDDMEIVFQLRNFSFSCAVNRIDDEVFIRLEEPSISQRAIFLQTHNVFNRTFGVRRNEFSFMLEDLYSSEMEQFLTDADMSRRW